MRLRIRDPNLLLDIRCCVNNRQVCNKPSLIFEMKDQVINAFFKSRFDEIWNIFKIANLRSLSETFEFVA